MKLRTAYSRIMCFFPLFFFFCVRIFSCFAKARQYYYNLCDKVPPLSKSQTENKTATSAPSKEQKKEPQKRLVYPF